MIIILEAGATPTQREDLIADLKTRLLAVATLNANLTKNNRQRS